MSGKPPKKSDLRKGWMQPRRDQAKRIAPEYHLIVTEGIKTEPNYFRSIQHIINAKYRNRIHLDIFGEGDNTLNLFRKAKVRAESSANGYKHVWVVYDRDDFPAEDFDRAAELCEKASTTETKYHAVWSNQCIELWFLLHFEYLQADLHRSEYWPKLSEYLKQLGFDEYRKNRSDMFDCLRPYLGTAIRNAKALEAINKGRKPSASSPGTRVFTIIDALYSYL